VIYPCFIIPHGFISSDSAAHQSKRLKSNQSVTMATLPQPPSAEICLFENIEVRTDLRLLRLAAAEVVPSVAV